MKTRSGYKRTFICPNCCLWLLWSWDWSFGTLGVLLMLVCRREGGWGKGNYLKSKAMSSFKVSHSRKGIATSQLHTRLLCKFWRGIGHCLQSICHDLWGLHQKPPFKQALDFWDKKSITRDYSILGQIAILDLKIEAGIYWHANCAGNSQHPNGQDKR